MQIFILKLKRSPFLWLLVIFLLLLATALFIVSGTVWYGVRQQVRNISDNYITIAIQNDDSGKDSLMQLPYSITEIAKESGYVISTEYQGLLAAEVAGSKALTSGAVNIADYDQSYDSPSYNMAVLAVECISVEEDEYDTDIFGNLIAGYSVQAEILEAVSLASGYSAIEPGENLIDISSTCYLPDGNIPFEAGKTYLVYGYYNDFPIRYQQVPRTDPETGAFIEYTFELGPEKELNGRSMVMSDYWRYYTYDSDFSPTAEWLDSIMHLERSVREDGQTYQYYRDGELPRWAEYTGSWEEFLESEEGRVWWDEIIPLCEINQSSATVILSDNVQGMYAFNNGQFSLLDGRWITAKEYASGAKVCLVSAAYAEYNGYRLGDRLRLDYYDSGCYNDSISIPTLNFSPNAEPVSAWAISRGACVPEKRIGVWSEYEIVGIYTGPEFTPGRHMFRADTIFVPKASVPDSEKYENHTVALLQSMILQNGTTGQFLAYMEAAGYGDVFLCYDQEYSYAGTSLDAMVDNAERMLLLGFAALAVFLLAEKFLLSRNFSPVAASMRRIGAKPGVVWRQMMAANVVTDAFSVIFGAVLAGALFHWASERIVSQQLQLIPGMLAVCALLAFGLLELVSALWLLSLSRRRLIQQSKER